MTESLGQLYCSVCDHTFSFKTLEEALDKADHSIGTMKKRPCPNNPQFMTWNGKPVLELVSNFPSAIKTTIYKEGVAVNDNMSTVSIDSVTVGDKSTKVKSKKT